MTNITDFKSAGMNKTIQYQHINTQYVKHDIHCLAYKYKSYDIYLFFKNKMQFRTQQIHI